MFIAHHFAAKARYQERQQRQRARINQQVTVTDVTVTQSLAYFNRKDNKWTLPDTPLVPVDQLAQHIKFLGDIAHQYHLAKNKTVSNGEERLQPNAVTRLVLNEFSLYPTDKPLSLEQFNELIDKIETIAKRYTQNFTLVLASVPLLIPGKGVHNYGIHVQCGPTPKIDTFAKITPSFHEIRYPEQTNARYSRSRKESDDAAVSLITDEGKAIINHGAVINCETSDGAKYVTAIDMCFDLKFAEAKKYFQYRLKLAKETLDLELLPQQGSHILTSRSRQAEMPKFISSTYVHADPLVDDPELQAKSRKKSAFEPRKHAALPECMQQLVESTAHEAEFSVENDMLHIKNPPFGGDLALRVYPATPLACFTGQLKEQVDEHNTRVMQEGFKSYCAQMGYQSLKDGAFYLGKIMQALTDEIPKLQKKRSFWKKLFGIRDCYSEQIGLITCYQQKLRQAASHAKYFNSTAPVLLENFTVKVSDLENSESLVALISRIRTQLTAELTAMNTAPEITSSSNSSSEYNCLLS